MSLLALLLIGQVALVWYSATAVHFGSRAWDRVPESIACQFRR